MKSLSLPPAGQPGQAQSGTKEDILDTHLQRVTMSIGAVGLKREAINPTPISSSPRDW
jgi:hypothetical protein